MKRILTIGCFCLLVVGCSKGSVVGSAAGEINLTKRGTYNNECIDGVIYYENVKRLAPAYNRDGTLKLCEN